VDPPSGPPADLISYPDFANAGTLSLNGTAAIVKAGAAGHRVLRLTNGRYLQAGSAWAPQQIDLSRSFSTTFDTSLHHGRQGADGIAFVLQTGGPRVLGGIGGGLGYRGSSPSVAVEFDTYQNAPDPDANHVAVATDGHPDTPLAVATAPFVMFGRPFRVTIKYDAPSHTLQVWINRRTAKPAASPLISQVVDISAVLGSTTSYVGFTGATTFSAVAWPRRAPRPGA
jgi:hypothetical protein